MVRKSFYVDFNKFKSSCFGPVPVISCGHCCAAVMSFDWERTFRSIERLVTTECLLWRRAAAINMQLALSCCSRYMF